MFARTLLFPAVWALTVAPLATAADYYVDAVNGSNANSGTSPASAWLTVSHALAMVPAGDSHTIHVAPGLYDGALGEGFALPLRHQVALVGDQGSALTVIDAGGGTILGGVVSSFGGTIASSLQGFTLRNGSYGFWMAVQDAGASISLELEDVVIESATLGAIYGEIWHSGPVFTGAALNVTLDRVRIEGCGAGVGLYDYEAHGALNFTARDSDVSSNTDIGIDFLRGTSTHANFTLERCRVVGNGGHGVQLAQSAGAVTSASIVSSLIADNGGDGVRGSGGGASAGGGAVKLCTIAGNAGAGVSVPTSAGFTFALEAGILYDNGDDVADPFGNVTASFCDVGDGDFAGSNGNFSADPLFRAPASGDYRLTWNSPCVDAGDPAAPSGTLDLALAKRPIDGNLDIVERNDVGAFEFGPLGSTGPVHVGSDAIFEHWGPSGGRAILYLSRGLPAPTPLATPFGDFDLDPDAFRNLGTSRVQPGPPALRAVPIPNDPLYIGKTFSFQALSTSTVGSPPAAYTNPISITILP